MKKPILILLIFALIGGFVLTHGTSPVMAAGQSNKYGGVLKYNMDKVAGVIGDPLLIRAWNHEYIDFMLETLVNPSNDKLGTFEPALATSWTLAPDRSHYTFNLRKGVKFSDGTDWNAQAAKWNIERWLKSKRPKFDRLKSIEVVDDHTLKCNLSGWDAVTMFDFGKDSYHISPAAFEKNGQEWAKFNPIGTGPFKLVDYKRNDRVVYDKVKDYWEKGLPYLDGIHITQIQDPMTAIASLKRGEIDGWMGIDSVSGAELKATGDYILDTNPGPHQLISFNSKDSNSIWSNKKMRMALEYAIDKVPLTKATGRGFTYPVYEIVHSIPAKAGTVPRKHDPEKAKQLIKEAGFSEGVKVKLTYQAGPRFKDVIVALQADFADVGIKAELNPLAGAAFNQRILEMPPPNELVLEGQRGGPNELLYSVDETLAPGSVFMPGIKRPAGFNDFLKKALETDKLNVSMDNLYQMEKLAYNDAMFVPIYGQLFIAVHYPHVKDAVWFWGSMPYPDFTNCWLDRKK
ncbi:ABC transporter substrate-binding protein [Thermodesulfobacteriota bacterium]